MHSRLLALPAVLTALAALPAAASAAYAPQLTATVTPSTFGVPVAITTTITQAAGESNSKKVVVHFPKEMGANLSTATECSAMQSATFEGCPATSRVGSGRAVVQGIGELTGSVDLGPIDGNGIQLIVYLASRNPLVIPQQRQTIRGQITLPPNSGPVTTFDGLPDIPAGLTIQTFELSLLGGSTSLVANPGKCGTFNLNADFTSQKGETATSSAPFSVTGCPPPNVAPKLTRVSLRKGGKVRFTLSKRADVTVRLMRGKKDVRRIDERAARKGVNTFSGLFPSPKAKKKLKKGAYTISVRASDAEGALSKRIFLKYRQR